MGECMIKNNRVIPGDIDALFKQGALGKAVAWYCRKCGSIYGEKDDARLCCAEWLCDVCGESAWSKYRHYCNDCQNERDAERETLMLAKAEAIPARDYPDDIGVVYGGEYYQCLDDFIDHCEQEGLDIPDRVWGTSPSVFSLDADDILDTAWENWTDGCDDVDRRQIVGEVALRKAIQAFNDAQTATLYFECSKAVDLNAEEESDGQVANQQG